MLAHYEGTGQALVEAIAARTGTDLEQDMYPRILAGAVIAAAQVAVRRWSAADPPVPLGPLLPASARAARDGLLGGAGWRVNEEEFKVPAGPRD